MHPVHFKYRPQPQPQPDLDTKQARITYPGYDVHSLQARYVGSCGVKQMPELRIAYLHATWHTSTHTHTAEVYVCHNVLCILPLV